MGSGVEVCVGVGDAVGSGVLDGAGVGVVAVDVSEVGVVAVDVSEVVGVGLGSIGVGTTPL